MQIYAFIGKTGTGKSYRAQKVAHKYEIEYIIDDGILIKQNKVIAGRSAKTAETKIASVKSAIFMNDQRKEEMIKVIKKEKPSKILVLGTSDEMVEKIAENLELGSIYKKIYINEVASEEEISEARKSRFEEGKHIVPVPTFEIKEQFSGYLLDPLKIFNIFSKPDEQDESEKTIIRPTYSYLGKYVISEKVINSIINYTVSRVEGVSRVLRVNTQKHIDGMKIDVDLEIKYGTNIPSLSGKIRNTVIYAVNNATGINIFGININIKGIST